jgi:hypothetical protein
VRPRAVPVIVVVLAAISGCANDASPNASPTASASSAVNADSSTAEPLDAVLLRTVIGADPLLLPQSIPPGWRTDPPYVTANFFGVTYHAPSGGQSVSLQVMVPNPPTPDSAVDTNPNFRGDPRSLYRIDDRANPTSHRWLMWTEPGRWAQENRGGVPYFLTADGLTDAEFWQFANSLQPLKR